MIAREGMMINSTSIGVYVCTFRAVSVCAVFSAWRGARLVHRAGNGRYS